jgi:NAD(P)-dependent dehydrogenase (short-subunit alcohol dehydrogenase family)
VGAGLSPYAASKKGVSAHQLHRTLGIAYNSAWFMAHRVREAMKDTDLSPLGGDGKVIKADKIYHGKRETPLPPSKQRVGRPYTKARAIAFQNSASSRAR